MPNTRRLKYSRIANSMATFLLQTTGVALVVMSAIADKAEAETSDPLVAMSLSDVYGGNGFAIDLGDGGMGAGLGISAAGDVNGDGFDDFIVRAPGYCAAGECPPTAVLFGTDAGFPARVSLPNLDGTNGFAIRDPGYGWGLGTPVAGVGDVNGDGVDDIAFGSGGTSYVVFGSKFGFPAVFDVASLNGVNGFVINKYENGIAGAGDVNGDGFDDIIIGDHNFMVGGMSDPWMDPWMGGGGFTQPGRAYVVYGRAGGFAGMVDVSALDGSNGFALEGVDEFGLLGWSVAGLGDVNGDGVDDVAVGAAQAYTVSGQAFVLFGRKQGFPAVVRTSDLNGANGFAVSSYLGIDTTVSAAGDINGDGINEIAIGIPYMPGPSGMDFGVGRSYVVFGSAQPFPALFDLFSINGGNGFYVTGSNMGDLLGYSVDSAGDVNGDLIGDLIVGAPGVSANGVPMSGRSYVLYGSSLGFPAEIGESYFDGIGGFTLNGYLAGSYSGFSTAGIGDVNADGVSDVAVGTYSEMGLTEGLFTVVFGQKPQSLTMAEKMRWFGRDNCVPADPAIPANAAAEDCGAAARLH